jgi:hypothetical protein
MFQWLSASAAILNGELDEALKAGRKSARTAPTLPEKLERQREVRKLETRRDDADLALSSPFDWCVRTGNAP